MPGGGESERPRAREHCRLVRRWMFRMAAARAGAVGGRAASLRVADSVAAPRGLRPISLLFLDDLATPRIEVKPRPDDRRRLAFSLRGVSGADHTGNGVRELISELSDTRVRYVVDVRL
jgi:hypothetical protein